MIFSSIIYHQNVCFLVFTTLPDLGFKKIEVKTTHIYTVSPLLLFITTKKNEQPL